jgi:hypothetical protein
VFLVATETEGEGKTAMTVARVDPEARSTHAAAEGYRALVMGDTVLARQKYTEAGEILERASKKELPAADKHLLRFLAASQYYHGGDYRRAAALSARINPGHLRPGHRPTLDQFRKDVEERASPDYALRIRKAVFQCRVQKRFDDAIRLLQDHPYLLDRPSLAWIRADLCLRSGRIKAAVLFSADAVRYSNFHPTPVFLRAGAATFLKALGKPVEAAEFLHLVQNKEPTALDWVAVCADLYAKLEHGKGDSTAGWELLRLMDIARHDFAMLPLNTTADADVRHAMAHGCLLAAITADLLKGRHEAMKYVEAGEALATHQIFVEIFRQLRTAADGVWIHSPDVAVQLTKISVQLDSRREQAEQSSLSTAA